MILVSDLHREWPLLWLRLSVFLRDLPHQETDGETAAVVKVELAKALRFGELMRRSGYFN
jgi:hypothetical protein